MSSERTRFFVNTQPFTCFDVYFNGDWPPAHKATRQDYQDMTRGSGPKGI